MPIQPLPVWVDHTTTLPPGIASSTFSARLGVPVLVLFLFLSGGWAAFRIPFENQGLANSIGSLALILVDGGLRTSIAAVQRV